MGELKSSNSTNLVKMGLRNRFTLFFFKEKNIWKSADRSDRTLQRLLGKWLLRAGHSRECEGGRDGGEGRASNAGQLPLLSPRPALI